MQDPIDISKKVFSEIQDILNKLSSCQSIDELLTLDEESTKFQEYLTFLKVFRKFEDESVDLNYASKVDEIEIKQEEIKFEEEILNKDEETLIINEEIIIDDEPDSSIDEIVNIDVDSNETEVLQDELIEILDFESETEISTVEKGINSANSIELKDSEEIEMDSNDFEEENNQKEEIFISADEAENLKAKHHEEIKFRLSSIKGVKKMETLFEDDFLIETKTLVEEPKSGSLSKSNVSLDFMEAEKAKQIFRLDLNDRIAFTKKLFSGSQTDLNNAVSRLNDFETLDEAKEYLSEIYYEKGWEKEDEFAQRLWSLVESKFQ